MKKVILSILLLCSYIAVISQPPILQKKFHHDATAGGTQMVKTTNYLLFDAEDADDNDHSLFRTERNDVTKTYSFTPTAVDNWGVVGSATPNGWGGPDIPLTYNAVLNTWSAVVTLTNGAIKFRNNNDWLVNYGDNGADGTLETNGADINVAAGTYLIILDFNTLTYTINSGKTYYVNDGSTIGDVFTDNVGDDDNAGTAAAPFATIQHAVNVAAANDIIYVDAGTYTEQVTTDKGITITGAGQTLTFILKPAVVNAPPGTFPEPGVIQTVQGNIGNVHISQLSVTGDHTAGVTPIIIQSGGSVRNCNLQNGNQGIFVRIDPAIVPDARTFVVDGNSIQAEYIAINFSGANRLTATLTNNTLSTSNPGFSTGVFAGTDFGTLNAFTATGNTFSSYVTDGILVNTNNGVISQNRFLGTGAKAINKFGGNTINATCNWYGSADINIVAFKLTPGVTFSPWLANGTDNDAAIGFQPVAGACTGKQTRYYVNNNTSGTRVFTTAAGNDANPGLPSAPLASISAAYQKAQTGDSLFLDAGTYAPGDGTIGKSISIIGTNYLLSPNDAANPLLINSTRNAETIIDNLTWTIGANEINLEGLTFNTVTKQIISLNNTSFNNIKLVRNRVTINSNLTLFNFAGSGTTTIAPSAIVNTGLTITDNRFEKYDGTNGLVLNISKFRNVALTNNSFVIPGATKRIQTAVNIGSGGVVDGLYIANNTIDYFASAIVGSRFGSAFIYGNRINNTNNGFVASNSIPESSSIIFNNNILDGSAGVFPFLQYVRSTGNATGATSSFVAEENITTGTAVAGTTTLLGSMNLIFNNTVLSPSVTVRNNKITMGGDLSTVPAHFIRPIMLRGNLGNALVEKNEINLTGVNQQQKTAGVDLPVSPAITLHPDNGAGSFLQPGSVINILNNKINGFKHSFAAYDAVNGFDTYIGYGNIYPGVTVNINNNSFTGDSISINNGTVSGANTINATCNWYGSADAAKIIPKLTASINYSPWLTDGTDTDAGNAFVPLANVCNGRQNKFYVNDGDITGDVFTTAIGSDANSGIPSAPLATIQEAVNRAQAGDSVFVDAGAYSVVSTVTINKAITILGTNYQISPNDASNALLPNASRVAESVVENHDFIIGAAAIRIKGFSFKPGAKSQIVQTVTTNDFDNIEIENNRFSITSTNASINVTGKQISPLETSNYAINNNLFVKESGGGVNTAILINAVDGAQIKYNTFTTNNTVVNNARVFNGVTISSLTGDIVVSHNTAFQYNFLINGIGAKKTTVSFNNADECNRLIFASSSNANPNEVEITDNIVTNPRSAGGPVISYSRSNGSNLSSPNIARFERNTVTLNATGLTAIPQSLIAPTLDALSANTQVFIRNNKLTITGDFSSLTAPNAYVSAIRFLTNSRYTLVENNEMEFTATNYNGSNKYGIGILTNNLQPGTNFNFLNNKFTGFPTSVAVQNSPNTNGFGGLPVGVVLNINYNSFTGDVMSINNGAVSEPANVSCNWYGSAAAQGFISKLTLPTLTITPWLTNGTDNDAAIGFQPVPGSCDGYPTLITLNSSTNVTCNGAANGTINISTSYGKAPFSYTWIKEGDANFVSHDEDPTGLAPGTYRLAITDGNGSNIYITDPEAEGPGTITVTIIEPDVLTAAASGTNNVCFNGTTGSASVTPSGGTAPYTYLWSNSATAQSINNLAAGVYSVTVTDANGCTTTALYEVTQPAQVTASVANTSTACSNIATVTSGGGTPGFTYLWSNGSTVATISGVPVGTYSVTVTDANGCTATASISLTVPEAFNPSASVTDITCFGANNGVITVTNVNGAAPFMFSKDGGITFVNGTLPYSFTNLAPGTYNVAVKDANGCTGFVERIITQPTQLAVTINSTQNTCFGQSTGAVNVSVEGGVAAYSYSWTKEDGGFNSTQLNISNVAAGNYTLTVTDKNGCTVVVPVTINPFPAIVIARTITEVSCKGGSNGSINITPTGGSGNGFIYSWTGAAISSNEDLNNIAKGTYKIRVTDIISGCFADSTFIVTEPSSNIALATSRTNATGCSSLGTITGTGSGGIAPYIYNLNGGVYQNSGLFTGLYAGSYTIGIMDARGCTTTKVVVVTDNGADEYEGTGSNKNNTRTKAFTIPIESVIYARIPTTADSVDWYKFTTAGAGDYTVTFNHPNPSIVFQVYSASGTDPLPTLAGSTATSKKYNLLAGAVYNVRVNGGLSFICYSLKVSTGIAARSNNNQTQITETNPVLTANVLAAGVYPNPHNGNFTLSIESPEDGVATVELFTVNGQKLSERKANVVMGKVNTVKYSNMKYAILFYKVRIGKHTATGKIISPN